MAENSTKDMTNLDYGQTLRFAFNENERTIAVGSFVTGKVGHKVEAVSFDSVTDDFKYYDGATLLQTIRVIYTDSTKETFVSAERIT